MVNHKSDMFNGLPTWFLGDPSGAPRVDVFRNARNAADSTGHPQAIMVPSTGQEIDTHRLLNRSDGTVWYMLEIIKADERRMYAGLPDQQLPWAGREHS